MNKNSLHNKITTQCSSIPNDIRSFLKTLLDVLEKEENGKSIIVSDFCTQENKEPFWKYFENKIVELAELIGGNEWKIDYEKVDGKTKKESHRFPDIILYLSHEKKHYGIEVKTLSATNVKNVENGTWQVNGGSIRESTRTKLNLEEIYILCARWLKEPATIKVKYKKIEECIVDVRVTHQPRYIYNLNCKKSDLLFGNQKEVQYSTLYQEVDPYEKLIPLLEKKRNQNMRPAKIHKCRQNIVFAEKDNFEELSYNSLKTNFYNFFKFWSDIKNKDETNRLAVTILVKYPSVLKRGNDKYKEAIQWLLQEEQVICANFRDIFSAGGKHTIQGKKFPHVFYFFSEKKPVSLIKSLFINKTDLEKWKKDILAIINSEKFSFPDNNDSTKTKKRKLNEDEMNIIQNMFNQI